MIALSVNGEKHEAVRYPLQNQPVEAFGLFHIGGGDQHAHIALPLTNTVDQIPELGAGERVNPRCWLIKDQQFRVVDRSGSCSFSQRNSDTGCPVHKVCRVNG